jgi:hypothetical protein
MVLRASIVAAVFAFGVTGAAFAQPAPAWGNPSPVVEVDGLKLAYAKNKHRHYGWSRGRHYGWYRGHPRSYRVTRYRRYAPATMATAPAIMIGRSIMAAIPITGITGTIPIAVDRE